MKVKNVLAMVVVFATTMIFYNDVYASSADETTEIVSEATDTTITEANVPVEMTVSAIFTVSLPAKIAFTQEENNLYNFDSKIGVKGDIEAAGVVKVLADEQVVMSDIGYDATDLGLFDKDPNEYTDYSHDDVIGSVSQGAILWNRAVLTNVAQDDSYNFNDTTGFVETDLNVQLPTMPAGVWDGILSFSIEYMNTGLKAGLYDDNYNMIKSWDELKASGEIIVSDNVLTDTIGSSHGILVVSTEVKSIGKYALDGSSRYSVIYLPNSVTEITEYAFHCNSDIEELYLPNSIVTIGEYAFDNCYKLRKVNIPNKITVIPSYSFYYCNALESITIPESVVSIEDHAFGYTGLTSLDIPANVTDIGEEAFIAFYSKPVEYEINIHGNDVTLGARVFQGRSGVTAINILGSIKSVGEGAFTSCAALKSISFPDGLEYIGKYAFQNSGIICLEFPDTLKVIEKYAFQSCRANVLNIPSSVTSIGSDAFSNMPVVFYNGAATDGNKTVDTGATWGAVTINPYEENGGYYTDSTKSVLVSYNGDATQFEVPSTVNEIRQAAFINCTSLESITLPEGITAINKNTFYGCTSLKSIVIPESVISIGDYAFYNCTSLESINIPDGVTIIGISLFEGCTSLKSVTLPSSVTSINGYAFYNCTSLESISIPNGVTGIYVEAFYNCTSLKNVDIPNSVTEIKTNVFYNVPHITYSGSATGSPWGARSIN